MAGVVLQPVSGAAIAVLSGDLTMPLRGNWIAHLVVGSGAAPAEGATVRIVVAANTLRKIPETTFVGVIRRVGAWAGQREIVVVGGVGALTSEIAGDDHVAGAAPVPLELVAARICTAAGEVLDASAPAALASFAVPRWTRPRSTVASALDVLVQEFGISWRVLDTGAIWIGPETWTVFPTAQLGFELEELPDDGTIRAASGGAALRPGMTVLGRRVVRVRYDFGGEVTADLLTSVSGAAPERERPLAYREQHAATILEVNDDDTVDLQPEDDTLPGLSSVPIRAGIPGARLVPQPGDVVRVAFDGASPQAPIARDFDQDPDAARGVARVGDPVEIGTLEVSMLAGVPQLKLTTLFGTIGPAPSIALTGAIFAGSTEVFLR